MHKKTKKKTLGWVFYIKKLGFFQPCLKVHGFANVTLLCYDRRLAKVQSFNTDKERPFTVARCHPREKVIACGDTSGRILIFSGLGFGEELAPAKAILHWYAIIILTVLLLSRYCSEYWDV
jgi:hypothetical protein